MSFLLSIEVRRYDGPQRIAGEIVALEQAECDDLYAVLTELREHSGKRLAERVTFRGGIPLERAIEADPRRKGCVEG